MLCHASYARNVAWKWDIFFNTIEPVSTSIPYFIENGNHEVGVCPCGSA